MNGGVVCFFVLVILVQFEDCEALAVLAILGGLATLISTSSNILGVITGVGALIAHFTSSGVELPARYQNLKPAIDRIMNATVILKMEAEILMKDVGAMQQSVLIMNITTGVFLGITVLYNFYGRYRIYKYRGDEKVMREKNMRTLTV